MKNKFIRILLLLFYYLPITFINSMYCIIVCNENIDEILLKVSKVKNKDKISKATRNKILKEYLNDIYKK